MERITNKAKIISEQVIDLDNRVESAIEKEDIVLFPSLARECLLLVQNAVVNAFSQQGSPVFHDLVILRSEFNRIPSHEKQSPLARLKWLRNINSRLKLLANKLQPERDIEIELHPRIIETAGELFHNGHYSEAIFAACKSIEEHVKTKSGVKNKYGKDLMAYVFSENNPILKVKPSHPDTAKIEQEGFKFVFMGFTLGVRDPKAHYEIIQQDRTRTLQYLALASLLFQTIDDATICESSNT